MPTLRTANHRAKKARATRYRLAYLRRHVARYMAVVLNTPSRPWFRLEEPPHYGTGPAMLWLPQQRADNEEQRRELIAKWGER